MALLYKLFHIPHIVKPHNKSTIWSFLFRKCVLDIYWKNRKSKDWNSVLLDDGCRAFFIIQKVKTAEIYLLCDLLCQNFLFNVIFLVHFHLLNTTHKTEEAPDV